jgi:RHS repeat-associated protein
MKNPYGYSAFGSITRGTARVAALLFFAAVVHAQAVPSAYTTGLRYDLGGRVVGVIKPDPDGSGPIAYMAVRNTYNSVGMLVTVEYGELAAWQPDSVSPPSWSGFTVFRSAQLTYDSFGRKLTESVSSGGSTYQLSQFSYDSMGRLDCTAIRMNPAAFGSLPGSACTLGTEGSAGPDRITRNSYDAHGNVLTVSRAFGTSAQQVFAAYSYSQNGKKLSVADAKNNYTTFVYDGFDRLTHQYFPSKTSPGSSSTTDYEQYGYNDSGDRTSLRKRSGHTVLTTYDNLHRPTLRDYAAGTMTDVAFGYDLRGLMIFARFGSSTGAGLTNAYNGFGNLLSAQNNQGSFTRTLSYLYDANGNTTRITHPDGNRFDYSYDGLDRLTYVCENPSTGCGGTSSPIVSITYDSQGRRSQLLRGASVTSTIYGYDAVSRLTSLTQNLDGMGTTNDVTQAVTFNPASQILSRSLSNSGYEYSLATTAQTYATNGLNQYTQIVSSTTVNPTYDLNGNLTSDGATTFVYDIDNRLTSASGAKSGTLTYDTLDRLFQTSGTSTTQFLYDGFNLVAEYNASGTLLRRYVYGPEVDEPLVWYESAAVGATNRRYFHANNQGSVIAVANNSGTTLEKHNYDSFGQRGTTNTSRFQFTAQANIPELGLYFYKARFYSPELGRFLQTDPIGYQDDPNLYAYVQNDPINGADSLGLNLECSGDRVGPDGKIIPGKCEDNGKENDELDEVVVTGKKKKKVRLRGPEQFFKVTEEGLTVFDADSAEDCGEFNAYYSAGENFAGGHPGHSHPNGSNVENENFKPDLGPDDGRAAKMTGRSYYMHPGGIVRVNRLGPDNYTVTLVSGSFGQSKKSIIETLTKFNKYNGSVVPGGATESKKKSGGCTPTRTH